MTIQRDPEGVEVRYLSDLARLKDVHVLEVGCGEGRMTWRYASTARRVTAIDPDPARLEAALAARPDSLRDTVSFSRAGSEALPFAAKTFDTAILAWSL